MDGIELCDMPSAFKLGLATLFSKQMDQELPEGSDSAINLFPHRKLHYIKSTIHKSFTRKIKFYFDLLQCKVLANEVPRSMIENAYIKHAKCLSKDAPIIETEVLEDFESFITEYLDQLPDTLPDTKLAPNKAYLFWKRDSGGCHSALKRNVCSFDYRKCSPRIMPTVMHLEGNPGIGKSLIFSLMEKEFKKIFNTEEAFFCRSSNSKHWDGYSQQPVVGVDDFFSIESANSEPQDSSSEFLQMASTVHFQPPMASLSDKGLPFNSPIILVSSNNLNAQLSAKSKFTCPAAVSRRLELNFRLTKENGYTRLTPVKFEQDYVNSPNWPGNHAVYQTENSYLVKNEDLPRHLVSLIMKEYQNKIDFYNGLFSESVTQAIQGSKKEYYYSYPKNPKDIDLVEAYAIPEPLKVRMITKGHPLTWALKPLQLALFEALKHFPIFEPCWDPDYDASRFHQLGQLSVSGDYSSATDGLNQRLTRIVGRKLAEKYPELSEYILAGTSSHRVLYNKRLQSEVFSSFTVDDSICNSVIQNNGQLMGSLLSFPILCLVNAFSLARVRKQRLTELDCLIHGDDITFVSEEEEIKEWKAFASSLGLEPSVGKNYQSSRWFTIDSKLFVDGKPYGNSLFKWLGKPSGIDQISTLLEKGMKKSTVVFFYRRLLNQSRRSMDVPLNFGGLGPVSSSHEFDTTTSYTIYRGRVLKSYPFRRNGLIRMPRSCLRLGDELVDSSFEVDKPQKEVKTPNSLVFELEAFASLRKVLDLKKKDSSVDSLDIIHNTPKSLDLFSDFVDIPYSSNRLDEARQSFIKLFYDKYFENHFMSNYSGVINKEVLKVDEEEFTILVTPPDIGKPAKQFGQTRNCTSMCKFGVHHNCGYFRQ